MHTFAGIPLFRLSGNELQWDVHLPGALFGQRGNVCLLGASGCKTWGASRVAGKLNIPLSRC
jgi:hypothetical protein